MSTNRREKVERFTKSQPSYIVDEVHSGLTASTVVVADFPFASMVVADSS
jgi:hypothetical protein